MNGVKQLKISEITFPVYSIAGEVKVEGSKIVVTNSKRVDQLLVDLSHPGTSLGEKRIYATAAGEELYKLKRGVCSLANMIKGASNTLYIDSKCNIFNYVKSVTCPLKYCKLINAVNAGEQGVFVSVEGMRNLITADRTPEIGEGWVIMASMGNGYLFLGYSREEGKPSTVKI